MSRTLLVAAPSRSKRMARRLRAVRWLSPGCLLIAVVLHGRGGQAQNERVPAAPSPNVAAAPNAVPSPVPALAPTPMPAPTVLAAHPFSPPVLAKLPAHRSIDVNVLVPDERARNRQRAERYIRTRDFVAAAAVLGKDEAPATALLRARIAIGAGNEQAAKPLLAAAATDANLSAYVTLERGRLALVGGQPAEAVAWLMPLYASNHFWAAQAALPLASALSEAEPGRLLSLRGQLSTRLPGNDPSGQSLLQELVVAALRRLGRTQEACEGEITRFVDWPVAKETPLEPPACRPLTQAEWLSRIERLVDANRNEAARKASLSMRAALPGPLAPSLACKAAFFEGMVARKRRRYSEAEAALGEAAQTCADADVTRRALYTQTKVISIQDGLRALAPIEAFASRYGTHSMVDDVLFWGGDSLQRRGRDDDAAGYYRRILALPRADDHCIEAGWRIAWMSYRTGKLNIARQQLQASFHGRCAHEAWTAARAHYWLGRIAETQHRHAEASTHYEQAVRRAPLHFYAQQSLGRLLPLLPKAKRSARLAALKPPPYHGGVRAPCIGALGAQPAVAESLYLLRLGLTDEARAGFLSADRVWAAAKAAGANQGAPSRADAGAARTSVATARAKAYERTAAKRRGAATAPTATVGAERLSECGARQASLALCMLLERSGAHKESRARLQRDFAAELSRAPTRETLPVWLEAYPLAYREPLSRAEQESRLPAFLLQALAREESGFDAEVVSWAEAVGLTQLLVSSGQQAGRQLSPTVSVSGIEELLEPHLNARLGGALLGLFGHRLADSWPLALAAYNGGHDVARTWWKRFGGGEFAVFAEEMTIKETRMYVQRVLQTFGIYRWLYAGQPPRTDTDATLPAYRG